MSTRREVMLIADIGGYTDYMQFHRSILGHAEAATTRMLDKVVDAARGFDLIDIEGDAAFLSRDAAGLNGPETLSVVTDAVVALHGAFHAERRLIELNMCPCGSCKRTSDLTLKFVAHVGEVATQTIRHRKSIVGLDVIHVHRLLKNPVEVPEYLLLSDELYHTAHTPMPGPAHEVSQDLEGIGPVRAYFVDVADLRSLTDPLPDPSLLVRLRKTFAVAGSGLPYMLGLRHRRRTAPAF